MQYRHEVKHEISNLDMLILRQRVMVMTGAMTKLALEILRRVNGYGLMEIMTGYPNVIALMELLLCMQAPQHQMAIP